MNCDCAGTETYTPIIGVQSQEVIDLSPIGTTQIEIVKSQRSLQQYGQTFVKSEPSHTIYKNVTLNRFPVCSCFFSSVLKHNLSGSYLLALHTSLKMCNVVYFF